MKGENMNDAEFMSMIVAEICNYASENDMEPDDTLRTVADNIMCMLEICTFNHWNETE